jgi:uncharacterized protein YybS (DUF2232 family)
VQRLAVWLVARPERAVFILIATFLLPITQILGSAVLVLVILSQGPVRAALTAGIAVGAILVLVLINTVSITQLFQVVLKIWLPGMILALLLQRMRSLTLLLQSTVLMAMIVIIGLYAVLGDPAVYWYEVLQKIVVTWREAGLEQKADLFTQLLPYAPQMTGIFVSIGWLLHVLALLIGYAAYINLPNQLDEFGRFSDLNFGRVLALVLALVSIAAMITAVIWAQNIALVLFMIFWLQGLALLHWLRGAGRLPTAVLAAVYLLTVLLGPLLVTVVGVMGYTDAWFNYRARIAMK